VKELKLVKQQDLMQEPAPTLVLPGVNFISVCTGVAQGETK
jgi:hypothetical protein